MIYTFNLVNEPWIPCLLPDGRTLELGLLPALLQAGEIRAVADSSPIVTASIYRLMLAILHRAFRGPQNLRHWKSLWGEGEFAKGDISDYLLEWLDSFDLFHAQRPFYQTASLRYKGEEGAEGYGLSPITKLEFAMTSGNNPTLFDHSTDDVPPPFAPALVARLLVACQNFHPGGLVSDHSKRGSKASDTPAPLSKGAVVLFEGNNLWETLMYNLIVYNVADGEPFPSQNEGDRPVWEQEAPVPHTAREPLGYLDYLTWQSRAIRLYPESLAGEVRVRHAILASGIRLLAEGVMEPQFACRKNQQKNPKPGDPAWLPLRFQATRALWRDSTALIAAASAQTRPPRARFWLSQLVVDGTLGRAVRYQLGLYGLSSSQAKIEFWRREQIPVPKAYLCDNGLVQYLQESLHFAQLTANTVLAALKKLPNIEERDKVNKKRSARTRLPDTIIAPALERYWLRLEYPFIVLLEDLPSDSEGSVADWVRTLKYTAIKAFDSATRSVDHSGRFLRQMTQARTYLERRLSFLAEQVKEVTNGKV